MGLIASENTIQSELLQTTLAQKGVSAEKSKAILIELGLMNQQTGELLTQKACTKADLEAILAQKGITGAQAEGIISALGLSGANAGLTASFGLLGKAIWGVTKALLSNPITWIVAGFAGLVAITDAVTTSTEEYKEQLDDLKSEYNEITSEIQSVNSELQTTIDRMKELEGKDSLTFTEKEEYDNLVKINNALQRKIDLLELEEKQKKKEKNKTFVDTMVSDTENPFEHEVNPNGKTEGQYQISDNYFTSETGYIEAQFEIRDQLLEDLANAETEKEKERIQKRIDEINKYLNDKKDEWETVSDGIEYIENPKTEDERAVNEWLDYIADFQDRMAIAMSKDDASSNAKYKTNTFNRVVDNWQFDETVQGLQDLGKEGKVTAEMLDDPKYDEFINKLVFLGVIDSADNLEDVALAFNSVADSAENAADSASQYGNRITVLSGISETIDNLDKKVKPVMDSLKSAYQDIFTEDGFTLDNVGVDMLNSVKESIAEINEIEGIDIATSSFEDFARVLTNAETTEEQAHQAFNDLVSDIITGTDSTLVSSEAFNTLVQSLEEMGVTNAEEVIRSISNMNDNLNRLANDAESDVSKVNSLLTGMGKDAVTSSNKLTECTWEEIGALTTASKTYGFATDKIQEYVAQKIWSNQNAIDASNDIGQILVVAKSFGIATEAIARYEQVKKLADQGWGGGQAQAEALAKSAYKEILEEIKTLYNFELPTPDYKAPDSKNSSSSKDSSTSFDWIETSLSNMEDILDDLDNKVADTYAKWEDRNKDLADSILKTKEAIELQRDAAKAYEDEANSIGLSSHYKTLVQKGALDIETIKDKDLADRISNYQDLYEKSIECEKKALELERTLNELSSNDKWDLFKSKSDLQIEGADNIIDYQQSLVDKAELQGLFANEDYYKVMRMQNLRKQSELKKQYAELETILNTVPKGTEAYDTLFNEWMDIRNQLGELENEFIEFNNNIRDLDWEIFEYLEDSISRITEEVDFLKDLLSDEDMFDEYGNMTKYADATMGLHFTNIETYKKLAEDYYGEMQELQQQLADGAGQDVLEKYREYEDLHRDAITSIMDEKNAILDLVQNAYDEQINALERINDLTLERMDRERDLYNYQKNIAEKMKEKTSLERQISVYDGDDSEESKANTQRLKLELEKVNSDIEELQYEKQRADTEQMLTSITDSMKEWQSKRMDDEQGLLEEIKDGISTKSDEIKTTLTEVAGEYGTTLSTSLSDIFDKKNPFDNVVTAINNLIDKITGLVGGDSNSDKSSNTPTDNPKPNTNTDVKQPTTNSKQPSQPIDTQSKSETDSIFIPQKSVYPKDKLDKERSIEDRLKYYDYASDFSSRAIYYKKLGGSGAYTGSGTQNSWLLKKMKEVGYASGTNYAKAGLHWTQENGDELIIRKSDGALLTPLSMGDKVVNADGTSNLFTFANDPSGFLAKMGLNYAMPAVNVKLPDVPPLVNRTTQNTPQFHDVNMTFELPNVKSADDFINELQHSSRFEKIVQSMTLGRALGGNSMNKYKF